MFLIHLSLYQGKKSEKIKAVLKISLTIPRKKVEKI